MAKIRFKNNKPFVDFKLGTIRKRVSFETHREAKEFLKNIKLQQANPLLAQPSLRPISLVDAVKKYLDTVTPLKSHETQVLERRIMQEFSDAFSNKFLQDINLQDLELYQAHLRKRIQAVTVNRHFSVIKHFFGKCLRWEFITKHPAEWLTPLKDERQRAIRTYSPQDIEALINEAQAWLGDIIFLIYKTGLRRKEAAMLRWGSVDLENGIFHVESSADFHPKGYKPRTIPMTEELKVFFHNKRLDAFKKNIAGKEHFVFTNTINNPILPYRISKEVKRLRKRLNFPDLKLHNIRHTFCTDMIMANESTAKVQALAGHASVKTTEKYLHVKPEYLKPSLNNLDEFRLRIMKS